MLRVTKLMANLSFHSEIILKMYLKKTCWLIFSHQAA